MAEMYNNGLAETAMCSRFVPRITLFKTIQNIIFSFDLEIMLMEVQIMDLISMFEYLKQCILLLQELNAVCNYL